MKKRTEAKKGYITFDEEGYYPQQAYSCKLLGPHSATIEHNNQIRIYRSDEDVERISKRQRWFGVLWGVGFSLCVYLIYIGGTA